MSPARSALALRRSVRRSRHRWNRPRFDFGCSVIKVLPDGNMTLRPISTWIDYEHLFVYAHAMTDHDEPQRAILRVLLAAHPRMLGMDELVAQLPDVPRANEALRVVIADGLANRLGDRVGLSRAA